MKLLLDTHVFLWSINGGALSQPARAAFVDLENQLFLSAASYWKFASKWVLGN